MQVIALLLVLLLSPQPCYSSCGSTVVSDVVGVVSVAVVVGGGGGVVGVVVVVAAVVVAVVVNDNSDNKKTTTTARHCGWCQCVAEGRCCRFCTSAGLDNNKSSK